MRFTFIILAVFSLQQAKAQDDLLSLIESKEAQKSFVTNAFKSSRVINGHSMEFIGKGVLDVRILHRFGLLNSGINNLFGLDQANMRFGFDYGLSNRFTLGLGRSNVGKEWDAFVKYRPVWQASGGKGASPVSVVLISGITLSTLPWANPDRENFFTSRMAFYNELIIGRKFNAQFSLQLAPVMVHRNLVQFADEENDLYALGIGTRLKLSKRIALVVDYHYLATGIDRTKFRDPLSIGLDIETGGHVFQLHVSNSTGMNEKAFLTSTTNSWGKGEIRFGFNLSRVFTVGKK